MATEAEPSPDRSGCFELAFDQPQWAVTPGQSAVLYHDEVCLGGGVIAAAQGLQGPPALPGSQGS